ncbi:MAG: DegT/DnrJ/EryC1/StrS family aminotransferase [Candidatus Woesearchaeota archaeon]
MSAIELVGKIVGQEFARLTNRGNSAILHAIRIARATSNKHNILIQDQGGWLTYKNFPLKEGFKVVELRTDYGVIDDAELKAHVDDAAAIILCQPAGYFAGMDLEPIYRICKGKCLVIADVTGSIGDKELCNGNFADIMLGSFDEWKPVNLGYGGFISFRDRKLFELSKTIPLNDFDTAYEQKLVVRLNDLDEWYEEHYSRAIEIKKELSDYEIIHKDKKGVNVVVKFNNEEEKEKLIAYCGGKDLPYTICPRYIRVNENAVCIEVKRL